MNICSCDWSAGFIPRDETGSAEFIPREVDELTDWHGREPMMAVSGIREPGLLKTIIC